MVIFYQYTNNIGNFLSILKLNKNNTKQQANKKMFCFLVGTGGGSTSSGGATGGVGGN